ncbi:MAG: hypothetical protein V1891_01155 [bacterium]
MFCSLVADLFNSIPIHKEGGINMRANLLPKKILIIDQLEFGKRLDEETKQSNLGSFFEIFSASSLREARKILKKGGISMVLTSMFMDGRNIEGFISDLKKQGECAIFIQLYDRPEFKGLFNESCGISWERNIASLIKHIKEAIGVY